MNDLRHFAINADDLERARGFYQGVFAWRIEPWGPPGFYQIRTRAEGAVAGALQERRAIVAGKPMFGFECTFAVADVDAAARAVVAHGGRIVMDKATISGVGHLMFFEDTEGNVAGIMQYDAEA